MYKSKDPLVVGEEVRKYKIQGAKVLEVAQAKLVLLLSLQNNILTMQHLYKISLNSLKHKGFLAKKTVKVT